MAADNALARRWQELAEQLRQRISGPWELHGRGLAASLVRQPDPWTLAWIGFATSAYSDDGWFHAGVAPLVSYEFGWASPFFVRLDAADGFPRQIDLTDPSADDVLRRFAEGPAAEKIERGSAERMAAAAEKSFARPFDRRRPPHYWLMAPGWRVVQQSGSPEEPAAEALEFCTSKHIDDGVTFYRALLDSWSSGGAAAALEFLKADRRRKLAADGLSTVTVD